jgi:hypothetical protein
VDGTRGIRRESFPSRVDLWSVYFSLELGQVADTICTDCTRSDWPPLIELLLLP